MQTLAATARQSGAPPLVRKHSPAVLGTQTRTWVRAQATQEAHCTLKGAVTGSPHLSHVVCVGGAEDALCPRTHTHETIHRATPAHSLNSVAPALKPRPVAESQSQRRHKSCADMCVS